MTEINKPFFSIVIPTRQRHETLPFAIQTVLSQDFDDFELIICDNFSSYETFDVVKSFNSKKLKYIRSDIPLSMSENWELAIANTSGEYVIVFGDDDGLILNALSVLYKIIRQTGCQVVRWDRVYYNWSNIQVSEYANQLTIPFDIKTSFLNGKDVIRNVVDFQMDYTKLPMLYNSVISINLIERLKEMSGRIFCSCTPDIYSGFAFAYLSEKYLSLGVPMTINGGSAKSNGVACFLPSNPISGEFKKLTAKSKMNYHKKLPFVRSISSGIIEPFLQLQDALVISDIKIDMYLIMTKIIEEIRVYDEEELKEGVELIRKSCMHDPNLLEYVELMLSRKPINLVSEKQDPYKIGLSGTSLILDASRFRIDNVFQVSEFVSNFYDYSAITLPTANFYDYSANVLQPAEKNQIVTNKYIKKLYRRVRLAARMLIKGK